MTPGRSEARVYPNVNDSFGKAWWDYDGLMVSWGLQDNYEVVRKVGRGKVSRAVGMARWYGERASLVCK